MLPFSWEPCQCCTACCFLGVAGALGGPASLQQMCHTRSCCSRDSPVPALHMVLSGLSLWSVWVSTTCTAQSLCSPGTLWLHQGQTRPHPTTGSPLSVWVIVLFLLKLLILFSSFLCIFHSLAFLSNHYFYACGWLFPEDVIHWSSLLHHLQPLCEVFIFILFVVHWTYLIWRLRVLLKYRKILKVVMNSHIQDFCVGIWFCLFRKCWWVELLKFRFNCQNFPKWLNHFFFIPTSKYESPSFYILANS